MIVRCWRGRTTADNAPRYRAHLLDHVVPALRGIPGFQGARLLQRPHGAGVEVLVMTEWASMAAIRAFAGDTPDVAVVEPEARAVLDDFDRHVEHFDLLDDVGETGPRATAPPTS
ncbi:MAG: antibiotic biosynthesis monooxygenase [Vicinamibacterales bacterium]